MSQRPEDSGNRASGSFGTIGIGTWAEYLIFLDENEGLLTITGVVGFDLIGDEGGVIYCLGLTKLSLTLGSMPLNFAGNELPGLTAAYGESFDIY